MPLQRYEGHGIKIAHALSTHTHTVDLVHFHLPRSIFQLQQQLQHAGEVAAPVADSQQAVSNESTVRLFVFIHESH